MTLPQLDKDKANHFVYGAVLTAILLSIGAAFVAALAIVFWIAVLKEVFDATSSGDSSFKDILVTVLGSLIVGAPSIITNI